MVNRVLPYRVAFGEHNGDHSLVIHSAKGVDWYNVPPGLEKWLKTIQTTDILDVALGPNSQWYFSYNEGSSVRRRISAEVWDMIYPQMRRRLNDISKVSFGCDGELLAIAGEGQNADMLVQTRQSIYQVLMPFIGPRPAGQDISVVAFGRAKNNFVLKIANTVILGGHGGVRGSSSKKSQTMNQRIVAATLSPLDNNYYVITFDDGSSRFNLPKALGSIVTPHMAPEMSLAKLASGGSISGGPRSPAAAAGSAPITPKVQTATPKPSPPPPPKHPLPMPPLSSGSGSSTQLRLLNWNDPDFIRISKLFLTGWRHAQKYRPVIQHIYEVKLPPNLVEIYCAYRHKVLSNCVGENIFLMERELFHGTPRRCVLGNHLEIKNPCYDSSCRLCCVLRASFAVKKAGTADGRAFLRFGEGIYTSSVSSKADDYTSNYWASQYKVMLVARVVLGRGFKLQLTTTDLKGPPEGYHSVLGEVGLSLNYDEQVVFKDEAIRPAYVIVYRR